MRSLPLWAAVLPGCLCPGVVSAAPSISPPSRHPELGSGSISPLARTDPAARRILNQVQDDGRIAGDRYSITLTTRDLRVIDIARLTPGDPAANLVVARLAEGAILALSPEQRARLLRRRVPGRELALRDSGMVRFSAPEQASPPTSACFALAFPVDPGAYLDSGTVAETPCREEAPRPALRHDPRASAPYATAPLSAGAYLGRLALRTDRVISTNARMRLVTAAGPVVIERDVRTLQPARPGQRVFAIGTDGAVIISRLLEGAMP